MPKILHLETSSKNCSVAISQGDELLCLCEEFSEDYKHSEKLHLFIQWAFEGTDLKLADIDAISIGTGPGSYTGLRIAAASAKGFCYSLGKPLIAISSLELMAQAFCDGTFDLVIPIIDARRMEIYVDIFDGKTGKSLSETKNLIINENSFDAWKGKNILFVGDACTKIEPILKLKNATYNSNIYPSAEYLIQPSLQKYLNQNFENLINFEPNYLKEFYSPLAKK